jgi:cytochrome c peroxidase
MKRHLGFLFAAAPLALVLLPSLMRQSHAERGGEKTVFPNAAGAAATVTDTGDAIDRTNPFFQSLGTNGRTCETCHQPGEGWALSAAGIRRRFDRTSGLDPLFRTVDGSNAPGADVSTLQARRAAYSMLLNRGVIRVGLPLPAGAEFELTSVEDPYGFASAAELSLFRRPLPTTNLRFLTATMWDGRERNLSEQSNSATRGHAEATVDLTPRQRQEIVDMEMSLFTAQVEDKNAGMLRAVGARGGPESLATQPFYIGINDLLNDSLTGAPFDNVAMTLYGAWVEGGESDRGRDASDRKQRESRRAVARGETLFNSKPIRITGVAGVNDNPDFGRPAVVNGTCTTCHDTPNIGNHSVRLALNLGLTDAARRTPDMPLYTLRNKSTGAVTQTTDPGVALLSGRWADIGKFKGPILRGLAARPPYFHNGSAADLEAVIDFYEERFAVAFTQREKADLAAFLKSL